MYHLSKIFIGDYRFGFNGMEKVNEQYGEGNAYDFGARIQDPRLGRWLSLDPFQVKYPNLSPRYNVGQDKVFGDFINSRGENITFENFVGDQDFVLIESTPWFLERQEYAIAVEYTITESYQYQYSFGREANGSNKNYFFDTEKQGQPHLYKRQSILLKNVIKEEVETNVGTYFHTTTYETKIPLGHFPQEYAMYSPNFLTLQFQLGVKQAQFLHLLQS